jgi:hypothetical protein
VTLAQRLAPALRSAQVYPGERRAEPLEVEDMPEWKGEGDESSGAAEIRDPVAWDQPVCSSNPDLLGSRAEMVFDSRDSFNMPRPVASRMFAERVGSLFDVFERIAWG